MPTIREKQELALNFVVRAINMGFEHIVLEMPTGVGKTPVAVTLNEWSAMNLAFDEFKTGGYHLVTQLLLQDQIERDFGQLEMCRVSGVRSSGEYVCSYHRTCEMGGIRKCPIRRETAAMAAQGTMSVMDISCPYQVAKIEFLKSKSAVTNYQWMLTECTTARQSLPRNLMVLDEAHTVSKTLMRFFEVNLDNAFFAKVGIDLKVPYLDTIKAMVRWIGNVAWPLFQKRLDELEAIAEQDGTGASASTLQRLGQFTSRLEKALEMIDEDPKNWVYWQRDLKDGNLETIARPLTSRMFAPELFRMAKIKIYMSAYMGTKEVFCRELGLDYDSVAWSRFVSPFDPSHRPVIVDCVGSMSHSNRAASTPKILRKIAQIAAKHPLEKGLIHSVSYDLAKEIHAHLVKVCPGRSICPERNEREDGLAKHLESSDPTILISPSITEGLDFVDDKARWCIIPKIPWPYLPDKHIAAKKDLDPDWYIMQAVQTVIQASGRICRHANDHGTTYIIDSDFNRLWVDGRKMFPRWWSSAMVWNQRP